MIHSFTITNHLGDSLQLDMGEPDISGFLIKSVSGLGPAKATVNTTEVATNDGSMFNSARLSQRNIVFQFVFVHSTSGETIEDIRQKSYKYFPVKKSLAITVKTDNRYLKTTGYVESNEPTIFSSQEGSQVSIICPDPYFYSAGEDGTTETDFYSIEPMLEFPYSNESLTENMTTLSEINTTNENVVIYKGDTDIGMTITIHAIGEASNIRIYNRKTHEAMLIDTSKFGNSLASGLVAGDDIVVCTLKGSKSITLTRSGVTYNILNCIGKNPDWFQLSSGDNVFLFTADTGMLNLQIQIQNETIYEGV